MKTDTDTILCLRTCRKDGSNEFNDFRWPLVVGAVATAPDWDPTPTCGSGLHGLAWGAGDADLVDPGPDAVGLVVEAAAGQVVDLGGKVKFPAATVRFVGTLAKAASWLAAETGRTVHFAGVTAGDSGTATAGDYGQATAGDGGTATAGNDGRATAGDYGTATAGNYGQATAGDSGTATAGNGGRATAGNDGTATAGNYGQATAGNHGQATAGNHGTATAGYYGQATAGDYGQATAGNGGRATAGNHGTATAGNYGQATAGDSGTATAGNHGTATAGNHGRISIDWFDGNRDRTAVGYTGEDGIEAGVAYEVVSGKLVKA